MPDRVAAIRPDGRGSPVRPPRVATVRTLLGRTVGTGGRDHGHLRLGGPVTAARRTSARRTFVLDTSVLLADPAAIARFDEHEVVLPIVVITELEAKRNHAELGWFARQALRLLDDLRVEHGRLDAPLPVNAAGGTVRVELNHADPTILPQGYRLGDNDSRLLAVARNLAAEGEEVVLVSKDMPLRIKAASIGLQAQEYLAEQVQSGWTGTTELEVAAADIDTLYADEVIDLES